MSFKIGSNIIDVQDITNYFEFLGTYENVNEDEYEDVKELLKNLRWQGGGYEWGGYWYPDLLVHENHFIDFVKEVTLSSGTSRIRGLEKEWLEKFVDWEHVADHRRGGCKRIDLQDLDGHEHIYYCW